MSFPSESLASAMIKERVDEQNAPLVGKPLDMPTNRKFD